MYEYAVDDGATTTDEEREQAKDRMKIMFLGGEDHQAKGSASVFKFK